MVAREMQEGGRALGLAVLAVLAAACGDDGDPGRSDASMDARADGADVGRDVPNDRAPGDAPFDADARDATDAMTDADAVADVTRRDAADGEIVFEDIYTGIIRMRCSCHTLGTSGGLNMNNAALAYMNLVGHATSMSGDCGGNTRVIPGNAAESVLYRKVSGINLCEQRMPLLGDPLSADEIELIEDWIDMGAPNLSGFDAGG